MTFSNTFSWMKMLVSRIIFHLNVIPNIQLTISQNWLNLVYVMAWNKRQAITWANVDKDAWCHMASLGLNELMQQDTDAFILADRSIIFTWKLHCHRLKSSWQHFIISCRQNHVGLFLFSMTLWKLNCSIYLGYSFDIVNLQIKYLINMKYQFLASKNPGNTPIG